MQSLRPFLAATFGILLSLALAYAPRSTPSSTPRSPHQTTVARTRGLQLSLEVDGQRDQRSARLLALRVPAGQAASSLLPAGQVHATFSGYLNVDIRSRLTFAVKGNGKVKYLLGEEVLLEGEGDDLSTLEPATSRVQKGETPFRVEYTGPATGDAWIRLYWKGRDFAMEPVPPEVFTRDGGEELERGDLVREGRMLVASLRCQRCHPLESLSAASNGGMPELEALAPSLESLGARLKPGWLRDWLTNPRALRPSARMPDLLHGDGEATDAADLTAWLMTLSDNGKANAAPDPKRAEEGGHLFQELGCIACHTAPEVLPSPSNGERLPLSRVNQKFQDGALMAFLKEPARHYPWTRMPHLGLSDDEAAALAAFLRSAAPVATATPRVEGDAERGRKRAQELRCQQCHEGIEGFTQSPVNAFETLEPKAFAKGRGCLSDAAHANGVPDFGLTAANREALSALRTHAVSSFGRRNAAEFAERQIKELRCAACHVYDANEDLWEKWKGEADHLKRARTEKEIAQWRPVLTWAGDKLLSAWMERLFKGEITPRLRPWLYARMPAFRSRAELLAIGIPERHGLPPGRTEIVTPKKELVEPGSWLIDRAGFGCTACHGLGDKAPYATFEFKAVNFSHVHERLRTEFFYRWMRDPRRIDKSSRMPTYADEEGYTELGDVLDGVAEDQYRAMLHFLHTFGNK